MADNFGSSHKSGDDGSALQGPDLQDLEKTQGASRAPEVEATGQSAAGGNVPGGGNKRGLGRFGLGDAPTWLGVFVSLGGVIAALVFSGYQLQQTQQQLQLTRQQSRQTEKALHSNTAAMIYQEEREVWQRVTPDIYKYFHGGSVPKGKPSRSLEKARIVAGAMLDHFEHLRYQIYLGAMPADYQAWSSYIIDTFRNSPLLCQQLRENLSYYGGGGPDTIGEWAGVGCPRRYRAKFFGLN